MSQAIAQPNIDQIWEWLDAVPDPEIPVISLVDLGINGEGYDAYRPD